MYTMIYYRDIDHICSYKHMEATQMDITNGKLKYKLQCLNNTEYYARSGLQVLSFCL